MNSYLTIQLILIFVLIVLSAFFSGVETAFFSLSRIRVKRLKIENPKKGKVVEVLLSNPRKLLSTIIIGNMIVNILATSIASTIFLQIYGEKSLTMSVVVMSLVILFFGEITPKVLAINYAELVAILTAPFIYVVSIILTPIRKILRSVTDIFMPLFGGVSKGSEAHLTEEELETAVHMGFREGVLDLKEKDMIKGIFGLREKKVRDFMQPRANIVSFNINTPVDDILRAVKEKEYSRVPIYENDKENIIGVLFIKDLLAVLRHKKDAIDIRPMLRSVYYVPQYMKANILLMDLRHKRVHLAIVVDEYGALSGLITMENLIEEIIGETTS